MTAPRILTTEQVNYLIDQLRIASVFHGLEEQPRNNDGVLMAAAADELERQKAYIETAVISTDSFYLE